MKKPPVDLEELLKARYLGKKAFVAKFLRYWGTTTVDGVKVLRYDNYYYPMSENAKRTAKLMGFYDTLPKGRMKGVKSAYLYINSSKSALSELTGSILAGHLNKVPYEKDPVTGKPIRTGILSIFSGGTSRSVSSLPPEVAFNTPVSNQGGLIHEIRTKYTGIFETIGVRSNGTYDGYLDAILRYSLLTDPGIVTTSNVSVGREEHEVYYYEEKRVCSAEDDNGITSCRVEGTWKTKRLLRNTYQLEVSIPAITYYESSPLVVKILEDLRNPISLSAQVTVAALGSIVASGSANPKPTVALDSSLYNDDEGFGAQYSPPPAPKNPSLWVLSGGRYYLRADALSTNTLTLDDRILLIGSIVDSEVNEKSGGLLETLIAIIVIIIAIWLTILSMGTAAPLLVAAVAITMASLGLALLSLAADAAGNEELTAAASSLGKTISPLAKIASIITIFYSIASAYAKAAAAAATAANATAVAAVSSIEAFLDVVVEIVVDYATDATVPKVLTAVGMTVELYQNNQMKDLREEVKTKATRLAAEAEALEGNNLQDLARAFMKTYSQPLKNDWAHYSYDAPYEPTRGPLHIGNIQATAVTAMNLSDRSSMV